MSDVLEPGTLAPQPPEPAPPPPPPPEAEGALELLLAPEDVPALSRLPGMTRDGSSRPCSLVWFDDPDFSLAADGRILLRDGKSWAMAAIEAPDAPPWPACSPAPEYSRAASPDALSPTPPFEVAPVGAFEGRRRPLAAGRLRVTVLHGELRGLVGTRPACRLTLQGPRDGLLETLPSLAELRVGVPRASLAREALSVARGCKLPARHLGAPALPGDTTVSDGLAVIIAHLLDALLHWADRFRLEPAVDAVHQARVATRRLRSALSLYKRAVPCPELETARAELKACATLLGAARDWDVFLDTTGARLREAPRAAPLLRAARRRREEAYAELRSYLDSPGFRSLELRLGAAASLRPWERRIDPAAAHEPTAAFASAVLAHRAKRVRRRGRDLTSLPIPELHELRKDCKQLRYAAEFFSGGFGSKAVKPFVRRLATLQEELGALNDAAVAAQLVDQLGRPGRGYAGGLVEGWAGAATDASARADIAKAWKRFRATPSFWSA